MAKGAVDHSIRDHDGLADDLGVRRPAQCISRPAARLRGKPGSNSSGSTTKGNNSGAGLFLIPLLHAYYLSCLRAYHIGGGGG